MNLLYVIISIIVGSLAIVSTIGSVFYMMGKIVNHISMLAKQFEHLKNIIIEGLNQRISDLENRLSRIEERCLERGSKKDN